MKSDNIMDKILVIVAVFLLVFIVVMIAVFLRCSCVPDTLITCVFAVCGGECGIMGWIKTNKDKQRERRWRLEDNKNSPSEDTKGMG